MTMGNLGTGKVTMTVYLPDHQLLNGVVAHSKEKEKWDG